MLATAALDLSVDFTGTLDAGVGVAVLLFPAALGASVRYRARVAVQAQAGRALAPSDPAFAVEALRALEQEASRTLEEMRAVAGLLRAGEGAELVPQRGIEDLQRLTEGTAGRTSGCT
jgi:hypothetical protein